MEKKTFHSLGPPKKIAEYKGNELLLYNSKKLRDMIGFKYEYWLREKEKEGVIPEPHFRIKGRKYYTIWELLFLQDLLARHGNPRMSKIQHPKFVEEWHEGWGAIRNALDNGELPDIPIRLRYDNFEELKAELATFLASKGYQSEVLIDDMARYLYFRSLT